MALTRARVVAGDASLGVDVAETIRATLTRKRDPAKVADDARAMRSLIAAEKGDKNLWDLKLVAGGLIDIEFIAQYLQLSFAHKRPAILDVSTGKVIEKAGVAGLISSDEAAVLRDAHRLYTDATQLMRLATSGPFDPAKAAVGVKRRIAAGFPSFEAFASVLDETRNRVRTTFQAILTR
jgi:glutamate-ammonia-ligase adenylyltransferase